MTEVWHKPSSFIYAVRFKRDRGGSRLSGKGVHMYKGVGVRFAYFKTFFLNSS